MGCVLSKSRRIVVGQQQVHQGHQAEISEGTFQKLNNARDSIPEILEKSTNKPSCNRDSVPAIDSMGCELSKQIGQQQAHQSHPADSSEGTYHIPDIVENSANATTCNRNSVPGIVATGCALSKSRRIVAVVEQQADQAVISERTLNKCMEISNDARDSNPGIVEHSGNTPGSPGIVSLGCALTKTIPEIVPTDNIDSITHFSEAPHWTQVFSIFFQAGEIDFGSALAINKKSRRRSSFKRILLSLTEFNVLEECNGPGTSVCLRSKYGYAQPKPNCNQSAFFFRPEEISFDSTVALARNSKSVRRRSSFSRAFACECIINDEFPLFNDAVSYCLVSKYRHKTKQVNINTKAFFCCGEDVFPSFSVPASSNKNPSNRRRPDFTESMMTDFQKRLDRSVQISSRVTPKLPRAIDSETEQLRLTIVARHAHEHRRLCLVKTSSSDPAQFPFDAQHFTLPRFVQSKRAFVILRIEFGITSLSEDIVAQYSLASEGFDFNVQLFPQLTTTADFDNCWPSAFEEDFEMGFTKIPTQSQEELEKQATKTIPIPVCFLRCGILFSKVNFRPDFEYYGQSFPSFEALEEQLKVKEEGWVNTLTAEKECWAVPPQNVILHDITLSDQEQCILKKEEKEKALADSIQAENARLQVLEDNWINILDVDVVTSWTMFPCNIILDDITLNTQEKYIKSKELKAKKNHQEQFFLEREQGWVDPSEGALQSWIEFPQNVILNDITLESQEVFLKRMEAKHKSTDNQNEWLEREQAWVDPLDGNVKGWNELPLNVIANDITLEQQELLMEWRKKRLPLTQAQIERRRKRFDSSNMCWPHPSFFEVDYVYPPFNSLVPDLEFARHVRLLQEAANKQELEEKGAQMTFWPLNRKLWSGQLLVEYFKTNTVCKRIENRPLKSKFKILVGGRQLRIPHNFSQVERSLLYSQPEKQEVKSEPPVEIAAGDHTQFIVPENVAKNIGLGEEIVKLEGKLSLNGALSGPDCNLLVDAVAIPLSKSEQIIKMQVVFNKDKPEAKFDFDNYGVKSVVIKSPNQTEVVSFQVNVTPDMSVRSAKEYAFYNAFTNEPINIKQMLVLKNKKTGEHKALTENGVNHVSLPAIDDGVWCIEIESAGYECATRPFVHIGCLEPKEHEKVFLNPTGTMNDDQLRVVLAWNEQPSDLDLHCVSSDGGHVFFSNKKHKDIELDVDVTTGYGPETMTLKIQKGIKYFFFVHHYSDDSVNLAKSGAVIHTFGKGSQSIKKIEIDSRVSIPYAHGQGVWEVFKIDKQEGMEVVNRITRKGTSELVRHFSNSCTWPSSTSVLRPHISTRAATADNIGRDRSRRLPMHTRRAVTAETRQAANARLIVPNPVNLGTPASAWVAEGGEMNAEEGPRRLSNTTTVHDLLSTFSDQPILFLSSAETSPAPDQNRS